MRTPGATRGDRARRQDRATESAHRIIRNSIPATGHSRGVRTEGHCRGGIAEGHTTEKRGQERAQERRSLKKSSMSRAHSSARTPAYTSGAGATRPSRSTS